MTSTTHFGPEEPMRGGHPRIKSRDALDRTAADALRAQLKASPNPAVLLVKPAKYHTLEAGAAIKVVTPSGSYYGTLIDVSTREKHKRDLVTGAILSTEIVGGNLSYVPADPDTVWVNRATGEKQDMKIEKSVVTSGCYLLYRVSEQARHD